MKNSQITIGTAAWNIPKEFASLFPTHGSHLERYAQILNGVEINSSFYREHKPITYEKWAKSVPPSFRFSVKLFQYFTHVMRLKEAGPKLAQTLDGISQLGEKLGVILVQLPPSLDFQVDDHIHFFTEFRKNYKGKLALEPRHESWNSPAAQSLLEEFKISRVVADPDPSPPPSTRKEIQDIVYYRLHGSPVIYRSNYAGEALKGWREKIAASLRDNKQVWCIFDNTTFGYATQNAVELLETFSPQISGSLETQAAS